MKDVNLLLLVSSVFFFSKTPLAADENYLKRLVSGNGSINAINSEAKQYDITSADYTLPDVTLMDAEGKAVRLKEKLAQPRPVLMQFIFTSCSTICPLLSATFSQAQKEMDRLKVDYQLISISIDPEYDNTEKMASYAKRFHAGANWLFLTGRRNDVRSLLIAFDALYQSDNKMYHRPLFYLHPLPNAPWLRIEGFISASDLISQILSARSSS